MAKKRSKKHDILAPLDDVGCNCDFENDYGIGDDLDNVEQGQQVADDVNYEYDNDAEEDQELEGGAHLLPKKEKESSNKLLLTTKSNKVLTADIETFKHAHEP